VTLGIGATSAIFSVISEAARKLWPAGENTIGARVRLGVLERVPPRVVADPNRPPEVTIIGVVGVRGMPAYAPIRPRLS
jgi:hypothetical protein